MNAARQRTEAPVSARDVPEGLRADAARLLERRPDARAVVLFGSRARGDAHEFSDWDIALIVPDGERPGLLSEAEHGFSEPAVQCLELPEPAIEADARTVGRLARGVLRDAVTLAGEWEHELPMEGLRMDVDDYLNCLTMGREKLLEGAGAYARLGHGPGGAREDDSLCNVFVQRSADAAERLGKALLIRRGLDPRHRHSMAALAAQAREAGHPEAARRLAALNGETDRDHQADYFGDAAANAAQCRRAVTRLAGAWALYAELMADWPDEVLESDREAHLRGLGELLPGALDGVLQGRLGDCHDPASPPPKAAALLAGQDALAESVRNALDLVASAVESLEGQHGRRSP